MDDIEQLQRDNIRFRAKLLRALRFRVWTTALFMLTGAFLGAVVATALIDPITVLVPCEGIET